MKDLLVGSTGFVGGNLIAKHEFSANCHSTDIYNYYNSNPELCVYAGVPAEMFLANANPEADLTLIKKARENIKNINPKQLVLISSIAVYNDSYGKNELSYMETENLPAYGSNRLQLENWVREDFPEALIIRLPALYGVGLKKNFIYDFNAIIPSKLNDKMFKELSNKSNLINKYYIKNNDGFYHLTEKNSGLKEFFIHNDFNALSFTDSRSKYQFYNLARLWSDISIALDNKIKLLNICTPPVSAGEVYKYLTGNNWTNILSSMPLNYDMHSIYSELLGGKGFYLYTKDDELNDLKKYVEDLKR